MTQAANAAPVEDRLARLESDLDTLLHVLAPLAQQVELMRGDVRGIEVLLTRHVDAHIQERLEHCPRPDGFQVPAPDAFTESFSPPTLLLRLACPACQFVHPQRIEMVDDGLMVHCVPGVMRRATSSERDAVRLAAARLIGSARFDERREEARR